MMMNEVKWDRFTRTWVGVVLIASGLAVWGWLGALIGLVPLATGMAGWCPLYALFKINTCSWKRQ